jgi:2-hydroxychromene-2-carboxylate isomerase
LWFSYFARDIHRSAEFAGIPFAWAKPDPVYMDPATRTYPKDQPFIHRLTRLGMAANERGKGLAFIAEISRLIWNGQVCGWNEGAHLAEATARAGLDLAELDAAIAVPGEAERLDAIIAGHQEQQREGGHYGVPLMVFEGEPFFGQDRFDQLVWRMRQKGLTAR